MTRARSKPTKPKAAEAEASMGNYEAASYTDRRIQYFGSAPKDNRQEVTTSVRMSLLMKSRYAEKNYPSMCQFALDSVTYVVGDGIMPNSHAKNPEIGAEHVAYYLRKNRRPDITKRFSYSDLQKIKIHTWSIDGQVFVIRVKDAEGNLKQQVIESHRCVSPAKPKAGEVWTDGIRYGFAGEVLEYNFRMDDGRDEAMPAAAVRHIFKPLRASAGHGLPPLSQALTTMQDASEIAEMVKIGFKDVSDIPRVITKAGGTLDERTASEVTGRKGHATSKHADIARKMGGKLLTLDIGEKLEYPVPSQSTELWKNFNDALQRAMCGGGYPYEFVYDATKAGSAAVRMNLGKAGRYIGGIQTMLIECDLDPDYLEIVGEGIRNKEIRDDPNWMDVSWTCPPAPSIDNGRDANNDREDLKLCLTSYTELFKSRSKNFVSEARQQAADLAFLIGLEKEFGLPVNTLAQRFNTLPFNPDQVKAATMPADELTNEQPT
jgi:capsid protein